MAFPTLMFAILSSSGPVWTGVLLDYVYQTIRTFTKTSGDYDSGFVSPNEQFLILLHDTVNLYEMTVPGDLTTCVFLENLTGMFDNVIHDMCMSNDGTKMYTMSYRNQGGMVKEFDLSTPYDPRTRTLIASIDIGASMNALYDIDGSRAFSLRGIDVNNDKTKLLFTSYSGTGRLLSVNLTANGGITGWTYDTYCNAPGGGGVGSLMKISDTDDKVYFGYRGSSSPSIMYEYVTNSPNDFSAINFVASINGPTWRSDVAPAFNLGGGTMYFICTSYSYPNAGLEFRQYKII